MKSADDTTAKAKKLGATAVEPFDVFEFGRMGVMTDPHVAAFAVIRLFNT